MLNKLFAYYLIFISLSINAQHLDIGRKWVDTLSSEYFFGRGYVNDGVNKAADFIKNEFQHLGLIELPGLDHFFQPFTHIVNTFPGKVEVSVGEKVLVNGVHFMVHPNSGGGSLTLNPTVINYPDVGDEFVKEAISDILKDNFNSIVFDLTGAEYQEENELIFRFISLANHFPVIFISDKKLTWGVGADVQLKNPVIQLADSIDVMDKSIAINVDAKLEESFESRNVAGYIQGKSPNAKTILFTAHYDHLGGMGSEVFIPGANDNASGVSMLGALANYYIKNPPDHHIVFIAFAGEEAGLLGSEYFVKNNTIGLDSIEIVLNIDLMGTGEDGITLVNGKVLTAQFERMVKINQKHNFLPKIKPRGPAKNSDHYYFTKNGVPAFFIYTLGDYPHYHDINDKYENLPFSKYDEIVNLLIYYVNSL